MALRQQLEEDKRVSCLVHWEMSFPGRGITRCQGPESEGRARQPLELQGTEKKKVHEIYKTNDLYQDLRDFLPEEEEERRCITLILVAIL